MTPIGAHVSAAGGIYKCIENAASIGANAIQFFGSSPQQWRTKIPSTADVERYKKDISQSNIKAVFLHAAFLPNLASPDIVLAERSVKNLAEHLKIAESIGAAGLVFHLGSSMGSSKDDALRAIAERIRSVIEIVPGSSKMILENSSGGGGKMGSTIEEVGTIFRAVASDRTGVCIDTAHAYEAGIVEKYGPEDTKRFFDTLDKEVGLKKLMLLHINDSKTMFNSHHDKHENIGSGHIGLEGFKALAKETKISGVPWILEVPGFDDKGPDKENIDIVKSFFNF